MMRQLHSPANTAWRPAAMRRACATLLGMVCAAALHAPAADTGVAADPPSPATGPGEGAVPPPTTVQPQESIDSAGLIGQTVELMRTAQQRLVANQLDDETGRVQRQIQAQLARLLKLAEQQAAQLPQIMPDEQPAESGAPTSSAAGGTGA